MNCLAKYLLFLVSALLVGCAAFKPDTSLPAMVIASPNYDSRHPTMIVVHYTSNDYVDDSIQTLTSPVRKVSSHYLIDKEGQLYQLVPENQRAWHAGQSYWGGNTDINSASIGIEIDNDGGESYGDRQIATLVALIKDIRTRYKIKPNNIVGHSDVSPGRKVDPGPYFPWQQVASEGIGIWCKDPDSTPVMEGVGINELLAGLGYDPRTPEKARQAFRLHYLSDGNGTIIEDPALEMRIAQCLFNQIGATPSHQ